VVKSQIEAIIYYRHSIEEVAELSQAIIPLADHIRAVSSPKLRKRMRHILDCDCFRVQDAGAMRRMLLQASKHAKANLSD
jgi:hypothetical protein